MSYKKLVLVFISLLIISSAAWGEVKEPGRQVFQPLFDGTKKLDKSIDFRALRISYTKTPQYDPYNIPKKNFKAMKQAIAAGDYKKAVENANEVLKKDCLDIESYLALAVACKKLGDKNQAAYAEYMYKGLVNSILRNCDGKDVKTAYEVISVREEIAVAGYLGLTPVKTTTQPTTTDSVYDIMKVKDNKTGKEREIYFNVNRPMARLEALAPKKKNEAKSKAPGGDKKDKK